MTEQPEQPENAEQGAIGPASSQGDSDEPGGEGVGDALRTAVERTLAATADSAEGTRQRAQELLDDVVRRGQVARDEVARRGEEATSRLAEAINELRRADAEGIEELSARLETVERRLAALEAAGYAKTPVSNPEVEAEEATGKPHQQRDSGE